jgi:hypothetical protein
MRQLIYVVALAGVTALTAAAEAGSVTVTFGVTAEVVRRCAVATSSAREPDVTCVKGVPTPRIGRSLTSPGPSVPASPEPRVLQTAAPDGDLVRVSVDF